MVNDPQRPVLLEFAPSQIRFSFSRTIIVDHCRWQERKPIFSSTRALAAETQGIHVLLFKYFQSPKRQHATNNLTTIKQLSIFHQAKWWLSWNETAEDIGNIGICHTIFGRVTSVRYSHLTSFVPFLEMLRWKNRFSKAEDWQWTEHPKFDDLWELTYI